YDNFPMNDGTPPNAFALALVPLSGRDPGIAGSLAGYLACPMAQLGASRFTLATIADFLRDPGRYEPKVARERALTRLLGPRAPEATRFALDTQQIEWGSWPRDPTTPAATADRLHDPAFVSSFTWTAERYPGRIAALQTLDDAAMREDILRAMRRRLAIARALPLAIEYLARKDAGRADVAPLLERLEAERASWSSHREAAVALETFLGAAGIPLAPARPS
ncbi:MAG TPA: beta-N-acetylglucosaminidase domain-containing protein, partial [Candidatus Polarisedimenticolaceae bacterium]|nr:beta-N-acetylglucosaminidase domain-containing protein [Candidatus Polarisedimenticolaceae bacterium]